ncbi:MAG TPA: ABC transporter permease, partial [Acidimicrobiales bacterium]
MNPTTPAEVDAVEPLEPVGPPGTIVSRDPADPQDVVAGLGADGTPAESSVLDQDIDLRSPRRRLPSMEWRRGAAILGAYVASLVVFGIVVAIKGANPFGVYGALFHGSIVSSGSLDQVILRAVPIVLAALAVSVPARAGLVNVGGEGQLIIGAIAATGLGVWIGGSAPGPVSWLVMGAGAALAGGLWAGLAGLARTKLGVNEAVTTLLMNFVANDIMLYLIYQPWKDPNGAGQPQSRVLANHAQLPKVFGQLNLGVVIAAVLVVAVWLALTRTGWGFALRVVGGNAQAAHRAGLRVDRLLLSSIVAGGALAGVGGMLNLAGVELQLLPDITLTFGYVAFLASWLGRHQPAKVLVAALLFSALAVGGNALQLQYGLDGTVVDVLLGLIVMAPLAMHLLNRRAR